jgi:3-hydroxybutyryl-CoA dehydratase
MANEDFFLNCKEGDRASSRYRISSKEHGALVEVFGDTNPLHVDEQYARSFGFEGRVMHGAIFSGYLSHFIGVVYPGPSALFLGSDIAFSQPAYLDDEIEISAIVKQKVESQRVLCLAVMGKNLTRGTTWARGKVTVRVR